MQGFRVGNRELPIGERTLVMGILNVTPDSFSDGGNYQTVERALLHAKRLVDEGADLLDIGGESTRPGAETVPLDEELERVIPVVKRITSELDIPVSIDTYKAQVAKEAIQSGAHIINDVWGAKKDPLMASVMSELDVPVILMHNREVPTYQDLIVDVKKDLQDSIQLVLQAGVKAERIWLDPGIGFAKNLQENVRVMQHLDQLVEMGYPVLLGTSRKSMIGKILDLPPAERVEGTLATVGFGIQKGCQIMRVHDVQETVRFCRMMDALVYAPLD
ncbi:dihydropteroate synthase [Croceifilum oryzae]|uniref:Dihydropteroate synthase n=1 Tax=Croceifilum oryzae TaxID=1553429 RepID=A0AAJ1TLD7_9BACL|nr:dihydropteroate synthase [Croceifilum oryzae]MDQ0418264.1 dihydropteroate synthase [Croceifilum oryzae]